MTSLQVPLPPLIFGLKCFYRGIYRFLPPANTNSRTFPPHRHPHKTKGYADKSRGELMRKAKMQVVTGACRRQIFTLKNVSGT